ncbi:acetate--CoA ligase family protein [Ottowia pentelensis]|jgi:acyl-CoA synthetase (NDP forming)|uniref:Acetate--CoA ligase family protein n=1 Tax=Ottowia pentelensis TaxID=511108 RepID=A0ABV6PQU6_9BURK
MIITTPRPLYRSEQLTRTFAPRSIAVVGVSTNPASFGSITYANIAGPGRFTGPVYMVNAKYDRIGDQPCYPSVGALPETPDCVFIAVPREAVEAVVVECAKRGVGGVVLFSSGFSETGIPERIAQQQRLLEIARAADMRLVGPNCVGFMNYGLGLVGTFGTASYKGSPRPRAIGLVSQSGAIGAALAQAQEHGLSLSHMLTCGNASDIDVADQVAYLATDPGCQAIACVFEGMNDPARFLAAAALCRETGKPLVVHKLGTSVRGAQAAVSHTGSVAGSQAAYRAAFEQAGVIMVDELEALLDTTSFFAKAPAPQARGVAVAAVSGGACILLADKAELHGVDLPHPTPATMAVLENLIPEYGAPGNPCDMTAQVLSTPQQLLDCFEALMADPQYGALVVPHTFAYAPATARIETLGKAAAEHGKIACNVWMTQHLEGPGAIESEHNPHVATFRSMNHCMAALAAWHRRADWLLEQGPAAPRVSQPSARERAAGLIAASPNATLTEREGKEVLAAYGVPVVRDLLTHSADQAATAAREVGLPVVLKVESPDIPHKTEAGVIRLNLKTEGEVRQAFADVMRNAQAATPSARITGVLVQPMVPQGTEIMVGARVDPQFGPMVVVGLGGIFVELLKDTTVRLAPVGIPQARKMLGELKAQAALNGFRGAPPVDRERLAEVIARISEFASDQRDRIAELDVNPLICAGERIIAVDALIAKPQA